MDAIIVSDVHLGSDACQADNVLELLDALKIGTIQSERLILNGDIFDSLDFRRMTGKHWMVLSALRDLSERMQVIWIVGNHEVSADKVSPLLGITVMDQYVLRTDTKKILICHGHKFDSFIGDHPILTWLSDVIYNFLQKLDKNQEIARFAKHQSKTFVKCSQRVETNALKLMRELDCDMVCCGHTHNPKAGAQYFNSGSWAELPCTYLVVENDEISLRQW